MKKILLAVTFVTLFLSDGAVAQTVFVPSPPVIYNQMLDPVGMYLKQEIIRQGLPHGEAGRNSKNAPARTGNNKQLPAVGYTAFKPRAQSYLPKLLAQKNGGNADQQREEEQFYESLMSVSYLKAVEDEDEQAIEQAHQTAKENLESLLGIPINKIMITNKGLQFQ